MKYFEIRDAGTFIPALAVRPGKRKEKERYLLARAGFGKTYSEQKEYIILTHLGTMRTTCAPFEWGLARTMRVAHDYIINNWDSLNSGDVIDVQFIIGETKEPKESEAREWVI